MATSSRVLSVVAVGIIGVAMVGMVVGFGHPAPGWQPLPPVHAVHDDGTLPAVPYHQMSGKARGPNRHYVSDLRTLVSPAPDLFAATATGAEARAGALARRATRRAFHGAPPTIPHPVDSNDVTSCYSCHGEGTVIGDVIAPKISHQRYTNCTQCHAAVTVPPPGSGGLMVANSFQGQLSPGRGPRAYPGAPPQIPHSTHMRENCHSCHGALGTEGLRSSHPWRVNCTQCHAPSAQLDQVRFANPDAPPWAGETTPGR